MASQVGETSNLGAWVKVDDAGLSVGGGNDDAGGINERK